MGLCCESVAVPRRIVESAHGGDNREKPRQLLSQRATRYRLLSSVAADAQRAAVLICLALAAVGAAAPAFAAPPTVSLGFAWTPHDPVVGQQVTFTSTSAASGNNHIQEERWDLNGDGQFGDQTGRSAVTTFSTPGSHVIRLHVVDKHAAEHNHVHAETIIVQPFANLPPAASFVHYPTSPQPGQVVNFHSTANDPDSAITAQRWDLDGNGSYVDAVGPTASRAFAQAGNYTIGLQVEDTAGAVDVATVTLAVSEPGAIASVGNVRPLFPFPVVRLSGTIRKSGIRVRRLTVDAPAGARTAVRCRGRGCPFRWRRYSHRSVLAARVVRIGRLDGRFLRARTSIQVFVTSAGSIGRYTRFKIRSGRPPSRVDRCLVSTSRRPVGCPAA
jgi:PKD repeat protein